MPITLASTARNAACNAVCNLLWGGSGSTPTLEIYDSGWSSCLAWFDLAGFGAATNGTATASGLPLMTTGVVAGTMANYKVCDTDNTRIWAGTIGTSGADMTVDSTAITIGKTINLTAWTHSQPA